MTKHDCKSETHSSQRPNERRLTVRRILYQYPPRKDDPPHQQQDWEKWVPWLQMKGLWLERAGFASDTTVKVRVMEGCLVITAEDS